MALRSLSVDISFDSPVDDLIAVDSAVDDIKNSAIDSSSAIDDMDSATEKTSGNMMENFTKVGNNMKDMGKNMSKWVTTPLVGIGTASIMTVSKFDDSMSQVRAISGATGEEFEQLRSLAMELGATTAHSASDAADGMTMLAQAGWDTNQILAGTPEMLTLASASGLELAQAASITTSTMSQFSMEAERAGEVADMFAVASTSADTNVHELGEAMKYAGGVASNMGMDLAQTNAILATFAQQGLVGSRAGTTFNAMFNDLTKSVEDGAIAIGDMNVEVYDGTGAMRDMGSIMADVEQATKGMDGATRDAALQNIFGQQAMQGINVLLSEGSERYYELEEAIYDSAGASTEMAEDMEDNIGGAFREMGSAIESFMITIGDELKPYVQMASEAIADLALWFTGLSPRIRTTTVVIGALIAIIGPLLLAFGTFLAFVPTIIAGFGMLFSPITLIIGAVAGLIAIVVALWMNWDNVVDWLNEKTDAFKETVVSVFSAIGGFVSSIFSSIVSFIVQSWNNALSWTSGILNSILSFVTGMFSSLVSAVSAGMSQAYSWIVNIWNNAMSFFRGINLFSIGTDIMQGLVRGISNMASAIWNKVTEIAKGIADRFKSVLSIFSPSRLFESFGIDTMLGYTIGFENEAENAVDASEQTAIDVSDAFDPDVDDPDGYDYPTTSSGGGTISVGDIHITVEGIDDPEKAEEVGRKAGRGFKREVFGIIDEYNKEKEVRTV